MVKVALRGIRSHWVRLLLTVFAVTASVAFMSGTQFLTATISTSFDNVFADVYKNIDAVVLSSVEVDTGFGKQRSLVDAGTASTVRSVEGVQAAEGRVQGFISILDRTGEPMGNANAGPPTFGFNWFSSPELNGWRLRSGSRPEAPDQVVLDAKSAQSAGYAVGDTVRIQTNKGTKPFTISGTAGFGSTSDYAGAAAALFSTPTAQELLGEPGKVSWIEAAATPGTSQDVLAQRIATVLPPDNQVITGATFTEESQDTFRRFFGFLGTALLVFGFIALFVGAFIIYNTFSIIVGSRTRELALLRAIGAGRGQVLWSVVLEAFVVGSLAALLGVAGGMALAALLTAGLESSGFGPAFEGLTLAPAAFISSIVLGVGVTVVSGLLPAWKAARTPPVAAMRDVAGESSRGGRARMIAGGALLTLGSAGLAKGIIGGNNAALIAGLGMAIFLVGLIVTGPLFAAPLSRIIGWPMRSITGRLARANAIRNPRRTSITASALMIGVGLVVVFAVIIQSVKVSATEALNNTVAADLIIDSQSFNPAQGLDPSLVTKVSQVPGVATAVGIRFGFAKIGAGTVAVLGVDPTKLQEAFTIKVTDGDFARLTPDQLAVSADDARDVGWKVGSPVPMTFLQGGAQLMTVGAIYEWEAGQERSVFVSKEGYAKRFPAPLQVDNQIFVKLAPGADGAAVRAELTKIVKADYPTAKVQNLSEFKDAQLGILDFLLALISALLVIAIGIAVIGIVNTLLLSVYERTREIGLLRAVGMIRPQVRAGIRWESLIFALQGTAIGTAMGLGFAWVFVRTISADQPLTFSLPVNFLVGMVVMAVVAGVAAALFPAWRAGRLDVLASINTD